jgi:hypothetical protein
MLSREKVKDGPRQAGPTKGQSQGYWASSNKQRAAGFGVLSDPEIDGTELLHSTRD